MCGCTLDLDRAVDHAATWAPRTGTARARAGDGALARDLRAAAAAGDWARVAAALAAFGDVRTVAPCGAAEVWLLADECDDRAATRAALRSGGGADGRTRRWTRRGGRRPAATRGRPRRGSWASALRVAALRSAAARRVGERSLRALKRPSPAARDAFGALADDALTRPYPSRGRRSTSRTRSRTSGRWRPRAAPGALAAELGEADAAVCEAVALAEIAGALVAPADAAMGVTAKIDRAPSCPSAARRAIAAALAGLGADEVEDLDEEAATLLAGARRYCGAAASAIENGSPPAATMAAFGGDENPASAEMYGDFAGVEMTKKFMVDLCMKHDGYRTPHVNDKLYLHQQGFRCIEPSVMGLYTGVRSLWLQQNGLTKIQGLENCVEVKTLMLHENCIDELEGLETLVDLDSLNMSKNFLKRVEGLEACTKLQTLNVGFNNIGPEAFEIEHVLLLPALSTLDVQANGLADGEGVLAIFKQMPDLRVLYCQGNPFVKELRNYRKRMISEIKTLRYLDDRPAERAEIAQIRADKKAAEDKRVRDFENFIADARAAKAADDAAKGLSFSGDRIVDPNRPAGDENADPNGGGATARFDEATYVDADELD
ncbi:dynein associated LRR protein [Aureococcus anophagefferens]|nr:dynein associated LRR protein [Aureococcus anophagefferens]